MYRIIPNAPVYPPGWISVERDMNESVIQHKRILLVDDEPGVREALRMMLECDEHAVTEANSGAEALSLFAGGQFDLVATDFEMPVMRGNALAHKIREIVPTQPILMITGYVPAADESRDSVDCILHKPLRLAELRNAIAKLLPA
jgi:CheY-like chemotaxis protein